VSSDQRVDEVIAMASQRSQRALLVRAHETRVTHHVASDDRGQVTL
jgi:hypothetical protein